jgi:hypothetical protein
LAGKDIGQAGRGVTIIVGLSSQVNFVFCIMMMVKLKALLPILLMLVFALTRWPSLLPWNFSAAYALMFCAGVYFPRRLAWWLPFATMFVTDLLLNRFYYHVTLVGPEMLGNYIAYAALVLLGQRFKPKDSWFAMVGGGLIGAIVFYFISNTVSWFFNPFQNPEYTKTFVGWLRALTTGVSGWPQTWEFFRSTLLSGGLFTGLFAGAMKFMEALGPADVESPAEKEGAESQPAAEEQPEETAAR